MGQLGSRSHLPSTARISSSRASRRPALAIAVTSDRRFSVPRYPRERVGMGGRLRMNRNQALGRALSSTNTSSQFPSTENGVKAHNS